MDVIFVRIGMSIFLLLGVLHLVYTVLDLIQPKRFVPADRALLPAMQKTRIRMRKNVRNFWLSYIGFHFSHSLGLIVFAVLFLALSVRTPAPVFEAPFSQIMIGTGIAYAALSYFFWFSIPFWGSIIATALFVASVIVAPH